MHLMATKPLAISRRTFLAGLGASGLLLGSAHSGAFASVLKLDGEDHLQLFASAMRGPDGSYALAVLSEDGEILFQAPLPDRGHAISFDRANGRLLSFARRPENFAVLIDIMGDGEPLVFTAPEGRHFYGHGVFSPDGRLAYAPENDFENARGVIGVYDMSGAAPTRIGELESFGIGPHDLLLSPDGKRLVVANGGIETHPDKGREKLNLETMTPSVTFIDTASGDLLSKQSLGSELHQLSLRHMSFDGTGDVWVGGQYQGDKSETPPLMVHLGQDTAATALEMPQDVTQGLQNYVGSVEMNKSGDVIAASCPRGGKILYWDVAKRSFIGAHDVVDGCGVAPLDEGSFAITDGNGALSFGSAEDGVAQVISQSAGISWDNHLTPLGILKSS